jgi:hypothetical protein
LAKYRGKLYVVGIRARREDFLFKFENLECATITDAYALKDESQEPYIERKGVLEVYTMCPMLYESFNKMNATFQSQVVANVTQVARLGTTRSFIRVWPLTRDLQECLRNRPFEFGNHCEPHNLTILLVNKVEQRTDIPPYFKFYVPKDYVEKGARHFVLANLVRARAINKMNFGAYCVNSKMEVPHFLNYVPPRPGVKKKAMSLGVLDYESANELINTDEEMTVERLVTIANKLPTQTKIALGLPSGPMIERAPSEIPFNLIAELEKPAEQAFANYDDVKPEESDEEVFSDGTKFE